MKKVIIINASPRKNMNTAQLLKEAQNDEAAKREHHDRQFPIDLQECFKMGAELSR